MKIIVVIIILILPIVSYSQVTYVWANSDSGMTNMKEYTDGPRTGKMGMLKTKGDHTSHLVKNDLISMMDTVTCCIHGNITSLSTNYMIDIVVELDNGKAIYKGYSEKDGDFDIMHIPAGTYSLKIADSGYKKIFIRNLIIKSGGVYCWEIYLAYNGMNKDYNFFKIKQKN